MAKIKKQYSFTNNRQIWRLIPADNNKLIIEERNKDNKEVFFNCLEILNGKILFRNFQLEDKFWVGIETVYKDIIFFHNFLNPEMPIHTGITAFNINSKEIIWKVEEYNFLFIKNDKVYAYKNKFDGREFLVYDYKSGEIVEDLGNNSTIVNNLRKEGIDKNDYEDYLFPQTIESSPIYSFTEIINELRMDKIIKGDINYIEVNGLIFMNFHEFISEEKLMNIFRIVEIASKKVILEEIIDRETKLLIPESFFIIGNLVFLIKEKVKLIVYSF